MLFISWDCGYINISYELHKNNYHTNKANGILIFTQIKCIKYAT